MNILRITDFDGIFLRDDLDFDPETEIGLDVAPAQGLYLPKWDGTKWIEAGVAPEPAPPEPTLEERVAEVESDVDVIVTTLATIEGVI